MDILKVTHNSLILFQSVPDVLALLREVQLLELIHCERVASVDFLEKELHFLILNLVSELTMQIRQIRLSYLVRALHPLLFVGVIQVEKMGVKVVLECLAESADGGGRGGGTVLENSPFVLAARIQEF